MDLDLVIFDCDGVLVDTERLTVAIEARLLTELGWPHTPDEVVARFMGLSDRAMLAQLEERLGTEKTAWFDHHSTREVHEAFERELVAVDGVREVMDTLALLGVSTCVASSGSHDKMRKTLGLTGLYPKFEGRIFSATEVTHGKPAPDLFLHAAAAMGAVPERSAVVEDSVYGVRAAVAAGMAAFGYAGGLAPEDLLVDAGATVFGAMAELVTLLEAHSSARIA